MCQSLWVQAGNSWDIILFPLSFLSPSTLLFLPFLFIFLNSSIYHLAVADLSWHKKQRRRSPLVLAAAAQLGLCALGPVLSFSAWPHPHLAPWMSITCTGETQICLTIYTRHTATNRSTGSRLSTEWLQKPNCHPCSWVVRFRWRPFSKTSSLQSIAQDGY